MNPEPDKDWEESFDERISTAVLVLIATGITLAIVLPILHLALK